MQKKEGPRPNDRGGTGHSKFCSYPERLNLIRTDDWAILSGDG
jgi:hypothetical protein